LEAVLAEHPFLGGAHYSLADVAWAVILARLQMAGHQRWWESGKRPRVAAWYERMRARPSYRAAWVWDRLHADVMAPLVARFVLPRLAMAIAVATAAGLAIRWMLQCAAPSRSHVQPSGRAIGRRLDPRTDPRHCRSRR